MRKTYRQLLQKYAAGTCFLQAAQEAQYLLTYADPHQQTIGAVSAQVAAPVLYSYVWWVLRQAQRKGIRRLYFLARDGCILYKIAKLLCEEYQLPISCSYLYCSRMAWRRAAYHLEDAYDTIFAGGYKVTAHIIISRAGLDDLQAQQVYAEIGLDTARQSEQLSKMEIAGLRDKFKQSALFNRYLIENAKKRFDACRGYLRQEGLLDNGHIAIVDTGWKGSMQHTLRVLLRQCGSSSKITGFYFGLYNKPAEADGEFYTWYFSHRSSPLLTAKFNNNLLECMCGATEGMTTDYRLENNRYIPVLSKRYDQINWGVRSQQQIILKFAQLCASNMAFEGFHGPTLHQLSRKLLERFMFYPSRQEAEVYGRCLFCDDMTESYLDQLVGWADPKAIRNYNIMRRLYHKLVKPVSDARAAPDLFWVAGGIALSGVSCPAWYRMNSLVWDSLRHCVQNVVNASHGGE